MASAGATYPGIGKEAIDLANGLVLRDAKGYFGSPMADLMRAIITEDTTHALVVVYAFGEFDGSHVQTTVATSCKTYLKDGRVVDQFTVK